jgi:hypothetical protein
MDIGHVTGHIPQSPAGPAADGGAGTQAPKHSFGEVLGEKAKAEAPQAPVKSNTVEAQSPLRNIIQDTLRTEQGMDAAIKAAMGGRTFSPAELMALQVKVFRYSQAVEVMSRTADKMVGALKQTLGTQV